MNVGHRLLVIVLYMTSAWLTIQLTNDIDTWGWAALIVASIYGVVAFVHLRINRYYESRAQPE